MKTKATTMTTVAAPVAPGALVRAARIDGNSAATSPWRRPTRRWFLGAVAAAIATAVVVRAKPVEALPTRWIGHC
ncbi:MAG: twin-arginine translocation signal domain-containing protein [Kofleriaceae bacterium]|nr:twin-arginine translocation signal domain-containing protein [Kofleriaceae bacterium]